jgi:hyperosmotically inducible periplasmic protein
MKTLLLAAALILALAACGETSKPTLAAAPAPKLPDSKPVEAPKPDPDKELAMRVEKTLQQEARTQAAGIDVTARDGVVTLWGTATSAGEQRRVAQIAAKVQGVKSVDNKLEIVTGS